MNKLTFEQLLANIRERILPEDISRLEKLLPLLVSKLEKGLEMSQKEETQDDDLILISLYIVGELSFLHERYSPTQLQVFWDDPQVFEHLSGKIAERYLNNHILPLANLPSPLRFSPLVSALSGHLSYLLRSQHLLDSKNPHGTALADILKKGLNLTRCGLGLLIDGFVPEALATWRTLYELGATLRVLVNGGVPTRNGYLRHMSYVLAFRNIHYQEAERDLVFLEVKEKMRTLGLPSKDTKRFIEYGWIAEFPKFAEFDPPIRFNFRDGIERLANMEEDHRFFELASEFAHSSPMLVYSNEKSLVDICLACLYRSMFILNPVFLILVDAADETTEISNFKHLNQHYLRELKDFFRFIVRKMNF